MDKLHRDWCGTGKISVIPQGGLIVTERTEVFTVYAAKNGYYAEVRGAGIVIGTTLSECCTAAQAAAAEVVLAGEPETMEQVAKQLADQARQTRDNIAFSTILKGGFSGGGGGGGKSGY
jgi:hypothetical protein